MFEIPLTRHVLHRRSAVCDPLHGRSRTRERDAGDADVLRVDVRDVTWEGRQEDGTLRLLWRRNCNFQFKTARRQETLQIEQWQRLKLMYRSGVVDHKTLNDKNSCCFLQFIISTFALKCDFIEIICNKMASRTFQTLCIKNSFCSCKQKTYQ